MGKTKKLIIDTEEFEEHMEDLTFSYNEEKVGLVRGRFQFDGLTPGRGELRYWVREPGNQFRDHECALWTPPLPSVIKEKMALLDVSGRGERVQGVGKKQSYLVYYLHFTRDEIKQMESEYEKLKGNAP